MIVNKISIINVQFLIYYFCNFTILDPSSFFQLFALDPLTSKTAAGNSRATAKGLELGINDLAIVINL